VLFSSINLNRVSSVKRHLGKNSYYCTVDSLSHSHQIVFIAQVMLRWNFSTDIILCIKFYSISFAGNSYWVHAKWFHRVSLNFDVVLPLPVVLWQWRLSQFRTLQAEQNAGQWKLTGLSLVKRLIHFKAAFSTILCRVSSKTSKLPSTKK